MIDRPIPRSDWTTNSHRHVMRQLASPAQQGVLFVNPFNTPIVIDGIDVRYETADGAANTIRFLKTLDGQGTLTTGVILSGNGTLKNPDFKGSTAPAAVNVNSTVATTYFANLLYGTPETGDSDFSTASGATFVGGKSGRNIVHPKQAVVYNLNAARTSLDGLYILLSYRMIRA